MRLKSEKVRLEHTRWQLVEAAFRVQGWLREDLAQEGLQARMGDRSKPYELIITSGSERDEYHSYGSLHYAGAAWDFTTKDWGVELEVKAAMVVDYNDRLGPDFDLILEDPGGPNEHAHLESQPKRIDP